MLHKYLLEARDAHKDGSPQRARTMAKNVLRQYPNDIRAQEVLALIEMEHGDILRAIKMLNRIVKMQPKNAVFHYNLALAQKYSGQLERAAVGLADALALDPKLEPARSELLVLLSNLGRFDEAEALCREIIERTPLASAPWNFLAFDRATAVSVQDRALLGQILSSDTSETARASLLFSHAEMLRNIGDYDASFAALKEGNDLKLRQLSGTHKPTTAIAPKAEQSRRLTPELAEEQHIEMVKFVEKIFDADFFSRFSESNVPRRQHIFVLGMPRSGSTLIEQVLSTHSDVFGAGETEDLNRIVIRKWPFSGPQMETGAPNSSMELPPKPPEHFRNLGKLYHELMHARAPSAQFYVNKMLGNYFHIGMIHMMLPGATIIDARREPIDNCFACFQRHFRSGHEFTYDLAALGRHYLRYQAVMDHWDRVLPGRVIKVQYEDFVSDPEAQMRRLLDACGLPWADNILRFYENTRGVRTASLAQVRQPMQTSSIGKWKPFEAHLGPLFEALGAVLSK